MYSDIWDDKIKKPKEVSKKLDFYDANRETSENESQHPESALDILNPPKNQNQPLPTKTTNLHDLTAKIRNKGEGPRLVDWKHSTLYSQVKEGLLTPYGKGDFDKLYKETDIEYITKMVNDMKSDVSSAQIIGPIHKKGILTLQQLLEDLDMGEGFRKIANKYREVNISNVLRILIR